MSEEKKILEAYEKMQKAMIAKDVETMRSLTTSDKTFTHMSGKKQTREEFFEEIKNGILNYYGYQIHDPQIKVDGDHANLKADVTLKARVYGISGSWTLHTDTNFIKEDGNWLQCDN